MKIGMLALAAVAIIGAATQAAAQTRLPVPSAQAMGGKLAGEFLREIDDPQTGLRWRLYRDADHPGGPGRLVAESAPEVPRTQSAVRAGMGRRFDADRRIAAPLVIRAGERVVLEESTPVVDARLEAHALGAAIAGSKLRVTLQIGGKVVDAIALGPGRVALAVSTANPAANLFANSLATSLEAQP